MENITKLIEVVEKLENKINELSDRIIELELQRMEYEEDYETFRYWLGLWTSKLCDKVNGFNTEE